MSINVFSGRSAMIINYKFIIKLLRTIIIIILNLYASTKELKCKLVKMWTKISTFFIKYLQKKILLSSFYILLTPTKPHTTPIPTIPTPTTTNILIPNKQLHTTPNYSLSKTLIPSLYANAWSQKEEECQTKILSKIFQIEGGATLCTLVVIRGNEEET